MVRASRYFGVFILACAAPAAGQTDNDDVSPQLWLDYNPSWRVTPRFEIYGDLGARTELDSAGWWRFVVRPSVRYQLHRDVRVMGGLGNFVTVNDVIANRWEIRPWQGVNVSWPRAPVHLEHFLRFEERFDLNTETWESVNSLRARYRLRTIIQWSTLRQDQYWRLVGSIEGFLTLAGKQGQFREQFRLTVGLERSHRARVRTRFDATWQREGRLFGEGSLNDLFLRVRLFTGFGG